MGVALATGCFFIAYAPSAALILAYASRRSALLILTLVAAFCWLLSLFLTSIVWIAIPPLKQTHAFTVVVGIIATELARWLLVAGYVRAEKASERFVREGSDRPFNDMSSGIAAGLGFGAMHTLMMYGAFLGASVGEAAFYLPTCPQINLFVWTAVVALLYNILHVTLMIITIEAYRKWSWQLICVSPALHAVFSLLTLANANMNGCVVNLPLMAVVVAISAALVALLERSPEYTARVQIHAWQILTQDAQLAAAPSGAESRGVIASGTSAPGLRMRNAVHAPT